MRRLGQLLVGVLVLGLCMAAAAHGAIKATETYPKLLTQINSGSVTLAVVNRIGHDVKVTLGDASTARVIYPPHQEPQLVALLKAHGAKVKFTRRKHAAPHHTLRYIGGAIVIVIIAAGGGMFLYTRRRPGGVAGSQA